ncbi:hypothetical protein DL767_010063 [Monosporascus sp. MG133]|nr:hypothetical protein DL767_010063 [Monosporascus sp. MG133]
MQDLARGCAAEFGGKFDPSRCVFTALAIRKGSEANLRDRTSSQCFRPVAIIAIISRGQSYMADDSDSLLPSASLTGQDRRRILLLNSTIELLSPAVYDKLKLSKRFSVERRFWGKLQTFILNVEEINWRFSMFVDQTGLVETLLLSLESMIHLKNGTAEEFEAFAFPRLETLRGAPQSGEAKGHSMVSPELLIMPEECESFKMQLDQLEEVLVNATEDVFPRPTLLKHETATSGHGSPKLIHKVDNLCAEIFPMEQARLDLDINGRDLYRLPDSGLQMKELRSGEIVTLSKGILQSNSVGPLHDQYEKDWGQKDPDKVIAGIKLRILQQPSQVKKCAPSSQSKSRSFNTVTPLRASTARKSVQRKMKFYDSVDEPELQQIKGAQAWFSMFDHKDIMEMLPKRPKSKDDGLKIAVLDTGINMDLPNIRSKRGRIKCWPKISACRDEDGHGTHVAYLLLRLAPHARLLVSKVSKSSLLIDADIQMIADAITHYSSGEDKADIINLSFGFPAQTVKHSLIRDALVKARQNHVLIFAAAGNSGGNETVSWPASMTSHVLRIDSSDGKGNPSAFSAGSGLGRKICTLGEGVPSCELKAGSKTDYIYRNGTSFATPIAAAIASIVLSFSDKFRSTPENAGNEGAADAKSRPEDEHTLPEDVNELVRRLRTKAGMEEILCQMCVAEPNQPRQGYYYITPWYFLQIREQERIHVMLNHLRRVSE